MKTVRVDPVEDRTVLLPSRNFEPVTDKGTSVPLDSHVRKALVNGDLKLSEPEAAPEVDTSTVTTTSKGSSSKASASTVTDTSSK